MHSWILIVFDRSQYSTVRFFTIKTAPFYRWPSALSKNLNSEHASILERVYFSFRTDYYGPDCRNNDMIRYIKLPSKLPCSDFVRDFPRLKKKQISNWAVCHGPSVDSWSYWLVFCWQSIKNKNSKKYFFLQKSNFWKNFWSRDFSNLRLQLFLILQGYDN